MERSTKGLPVETRQKLNKVAHLNKAIRKKEDEDLDPSSLKAEREQLIDKIKVEIEENDKQQNNQ